MAAVSSSMAGAGHDTLSSPGTVLLVAETFPGYNRPTTSGVAANFHRVIFGELMKRKWYQRGENDKPTPGRRWPLFLLLLLVLAVVLFRWGIMPYMARVLVVNQSPVHADAILVLGGGDGNREDRGVELYNAGWAPLVITTGRRVRLPGFKQTFARIAADYVASQGVPRDVLLLLDKADSTYDEAVDSLALAKARSFSTLIVVTDNYHTRRASLVFRHIYRDSGIRLVILAAEPDWFDLDAWWTNDRSIESLIEEYEKLILYLLRGRVI